MQTDLWKIEYGGTTKTMAEWGFSEPYFRLGSQEAGRIQLKADSAFDDEDIFPYNASLIFYKDSSVCFRGRVKTTPHIGSPQAESHQYEVYDVWRELERPNYEQPWIQIDSETYENKTHVVLGKSFEATEISVGEELKNILDFAISLGVSISYVQTELDALDTIPPYDDRTDIKCSEAIIYMLRWYPDCQTWIDYSAATPVLHFTRRDDATVLQYDCSDGSIGESLNIVALNENVYSGVMINYERQNSASVWNGVYRDVYPEGTVSALDTFQITVKIGTNGTITYAPEGLAETLYEFLSVLHYKGSVTLIEEECTLDVRPGKVLNLTGGVAAWATMKAMIQVVEYNLETGQSAITISPVPHLGLTDYIALLNGNRKRSAGGGLGPSDEADEEEEITASPYHVYQVNADGDEFIWDEVHMT